MKTPKKSAVFIASAVFAIGFAYSVSHIDESHIFERVAYGGSGGGSSSGSKGGGGTGARTQGGAAPGVKSNLIKPRQKMQVKRLSKAGKSPAEIAKKVGLSVDQVREILNK